MTDVVTLPSPRWRPMPHERVDLHRFDMIELSRLELVRSAIGYRNLAGPRAAKIVLKMLIEEIAA